MKYRSPFSVIMILGLGVLIGIMILQMDPPTSVEYDHEEHDDPSEEVSIPRGSHGG